ncbi:hypothetical protein BO86DRAFT_396631 [Aspergillus japonicus CBS 114.51]|uniref:Uncharacterized protein n=1 Tax=Aspergillus japonicus CBS 114.51 TaxID=1448312 RepID=A0A8T8XA82_ASPJA|nr:hypothetical protein BO86DRAFT_396631 [Aspergillus japonicus CBS 114.51]RAH84998.1 hypothetical protein BO86DRAFT_396631 [Aspergillus japonicus CBS 114.51]
MSLTVAEAKRRWQNAEKEIHRTFNAEDTDEYDLQETAVLLEVVRPLEPVNAHVVTTQKEDWQDYVADDYNQCFADASVLYRRGVEVEPCAQCSVSATFRRCVIAPPYRGRALFAAACANCIIDGIGEHCCHYKAFKAQNGIEWGAPVSEEIRGFGGLREAIQATGYDGLWFAHGDAGATNLPLANPSLQCGQDRVVPDEAQSTMATVSSNSQSAPWAVASEQWNDLSALKNIRTDLKQHVRVVKDRIRQLRSLQASKRTDIPNLQPGAIETTCAVEQKARGR